MEIKLYLKPDSPLCQKAKEWLKKKKLSFQEMDISESETYRDEILNKSSQLGVPVLDIDGQIVIGFKEDELEKIFKKEK